MWEIDKEGTELSGPKDAFEALRTRAQEAIQEGDLMGVDVRQARVRLRDETGTVLFEGTTQEAASLQIDGCVVLPKGDGRQTH